MMLNLYQVDAFATRPFEGNPAAVVPLEAWLPDAVMQSIAAENNLAETAFFVPEGEGFRIRWFTPTVEVRLCGHATLASAYVLFQVLEWAADEILFESLLIFNALFLLKNKGKYQSKNKSDSLCKFAIV